MSNQQSHTISQLKYQYVKHPQILSVSHHLCVLENLSKFIVCTTLRRVKTISKLVKVIAKEVY